jgi:hypothetical protein
MMLRARPASAHQTLSSPARPATELPVLPEALLTVYTPADAQTRDRLPLTRRAG